jgi:hypothetical protein
VRAHRPWRRTPPRRRRFDPPARPAHGGGFGAFLVSVPLVAPAGRMTAIRESWEYFVLGPADYTFVRPLGEL